MDGRFSGQGWLYNLNQRGPVVKATRLVIKLEKNCKFYWRNLIEEMVLEICRNNERMRREFYLYSVGTGKKLGQIDIPKDSRCLNLRYKFFHMQVDSGIALLCCAMQPAFISITSIFDVKFESGIFKFQKEKMIFLDGQFDTCRFQVVSGGNIVAVQFMYVEHNNSHMNTTFEVFDRNDNYKPSTEPHNFKSSHWRLLTHRGTIITYYGRDPNGMVVFRFPSLVRFMNGTPIEKCYTAMSETRIAIQKQPFTFSWCFYVGEYDQLIRFRKTIQGKSRISEYAYYLKSDYFPRNMLFH